MELLQFVFSSFWVWLGCVVLIVAAGEAVATAAAGFRQKRKVSVYHVGDVTRVEVENAGRADIPAAVKRFFPSARRTGCITCMTVSTDREKSRNGWATATPSILWTACLFWTKKVSAPCSTLPGSNAKKSFSGMSGCRNT